MANLENLTQEGINPVTADVKPVVRNDRVFDFGMAQTALGVGSELYDMHLLNKIENDLANSSVESDGKRGEFDDLRQQIAYVEAELQAGRPDPATDFDDPGYSSEDRKRLNLLLHDLKKKQTALAQGAIRDVNQYETQLALTARKWKNRFPHLAPAIDKAYSGATGRSGDAYSQKIEKFDPAYQALEADLAQAKAFQEEFSAAGIFVSPATNPGLYQQWQIKQQQDSLRFMRLSSMTPSEALKEARMIAGVSLADRLSLSREEIKKQIEVGIDPSAVLEPVFQDHRMKMEQAIDALLIKSYGQEVGSELYKSWRESMLKDVDSNISIAKEALGAGKKMTAELMESVRVRMALSNPAMMGGMQKPGDGPLNSKTIELMTMAVVNQEEAKLKGLVDLVNAQNPHSELTPDAIKQMVAAQVATYTQFNRDFFNDPEDGMMSRVQALLKTYPPEWRVFLATESTKAAAAVLPPEEKDRAYEDWVAVTLKESGGDVPNTVKHGLQSFPGQEGMRNRLLLLVESSAKPLFETLTKIGKQRHRDFITTSDGYVPTRIVIYKGGITALDEDGQEVDSDTTTELSKLWRGTRELGDGFFTEKYWNEAFSRLEGSLPEDVVIEDHSDKTWSEIPRLRGNIPATGDPFDGDDLRMQDREIYKRDENGELKRVN